MHAGSLDAIELMQLHHMFWSITQSVKQLIDCAPRLLDLLIPADRVFTILESKSAVEPNDGDTAATPFETVAGGVSFDFEGVDFAYAPAPSAGAALA